MSLKERIWNKRKLFFQIAMIILGVILLSGTIGKDLYYDQQPGLYSFSIVHFSGYLFFLLLPVEALVPYYLAEGHPGLTLYLLALVTAMFAQVIDYSIGNLASTRIINDLIGKKRYQKARDMICRYGLYAVFFFNLFPISSPIVVLLAGMLRIRLRKVVAVSFAGLAIKYAVIIWIFSYL